MSVFRVRAAWTGAPVNGPSVSTFFFNDAGGSAQDASDAVADFLGALDANLSNALTWTTEPEVDTLSVGSGTLEDVTAVTPATGVGGNSDTWLPTTTQGLIRWSTGVITNGRALKGRMFVPGFGENNSSAGVPGSATVSGVNTIVNAFVAANTGFFSIWSRTHGTLASVISGSMWNQWAYLSSRRD